MKFNNILDSPIDERDKIYDNICGISAAQIPDEWISPYYKVENQNNSMWCMSYSEARVWEIVEYMVSNGLNKLEFSEEFIMFNAKETDGLPKVKGTTGRAIADNAIKFGFCPESLCPTTNIGELRGEIAKPSQAAYDEASKHRPEAYARVVTLDGILTAIYQCGAVFTSLLYYSSMMNSKEGYIAEPHWSDTKLGGHSTAWPGYSKTKVCVVGNKRHTGFFIQLNSYGKKQGRFGIELLPFDVLNWVGGRYKYSMDRIFREAWCFFRIKDVVENQFFIDNQPAEVIKNAKPIDMTFIIGSEVAIIDGNAVTMDVAPMIRNSCTFVPFRFIFEAMDCAVSYTKDTTEYEDENESHDSIRGVDRNTAVTVDLNIGWQVGYVNGQSYTMIEPPFIEKDRTYIPLRAVGQMLGCEVDYEKYTKTITIKR